MRRAATSVAIPCVQLIVSVEDIPPCEGVQRPSPHLERTNP
jgi:hypothetical protein